MIKYLYNEKIDSYSLVAPNEKIFPKFISKNVKNKLGPLDILIKIIKNENEQKYIKYLSDRARKMNVNISIFSFYKEIRNFIISNDLKTSLINFKNLHIVNTELGKNNGYNEVPIYYYKAYTPSTPTFVNGPSLTNENSYNYNIIDKKINRYTLKNNCEYYIEKDEKYITNENEFINCSEVYALKYKKRNYFKGHPYFETTEYNDLDPFKNKNFVCDLLRKIKRNISEKYALDKYCDSIENNIESILITNHKIAVASIPSSKKNNETTLDYIIGNIKKRNPNKIINDSNLLKRIADKEASHTNNDRSIEKNINTLSTNHENIDNADAIILMDDVTTTGSSFIAANEVLKKQYKNLPIINISYAKTSKNLFDEKSIDSFIDKNKLSGIIFDFDNTLIPKIDFSDAEKSLNNCGKYDEFWNELNKLKYNEISKSLFEFISKVINRNIPVIYASNRNKFQLNIILEKMFKDDMLKKLILNKDIKTKTLGNGEIVFQKSDKLIYNAQKPSPEKILTTVSDVIDDSSGVILGIGNQESDMMAYRKSNIEPVFVNWFNKEINLPIPCIDYNKEKNFFNNVDSFIHWVENIFNI